MALSDVAEGKDYSFPKEEEKILQLWDRLDAFKEQLRRTEGKPEYIFFDGPPFATGLPHYGHILAGTLKASQRLRPGRHPPPQHCRRDIVTRYASATGHHVTRRFGWDCHGLPVEYEIDKKLSELREYVESELNVRSLEVCADALKFASLRAQPDWQVLGKRLGKSMAAVAAAVKDLTAEQVLEFERSGAIELAGHTLGAGEIKWPGVFPARPLSAVIIASERTSVGGGAAAEAAAAAAGGGGSGALAFTAILTTPAAALAAAPLLAACGGSAELAEAVAVLVASRDLGRLQAEAAAGGGAVKVAVNGDTVPLTVGRELFFSASAMAAAAAVPDGNSA
ncbi:Isoleucine--tRNA ligase [Tetrabaena socialis]|uniref:Isoleucine--tRNA ligase n=1 Tax=Tetrabaena socialis TaxID=47790 RepID=A0A2J7ZRR8_9CHLO|nr:Isoleucine--tRNA ligase [Tetrabaena socialis]|eukprot:PNH02930.1 Isoleucine--tRNA ligase [Tetrabaena socialis]